MEVPVLETARLRLRAHTVADFPALAAVWAEAAVIRFIGGKPSTPTEAWARLLRYRGLWPLLGFGYWAVEEKASGQFVGDVGFADFHRALEPPIHGVAEMGWVLGGRFHGKGYASEATSAALQWFDRAGKGRSVSIIDPANTPSLKVAEKNGFREYQRTTFMGDEVILLERV